MRDAAVWWAENRQLAPDLLATAARRALTDIVSQPGIGRLVPELGSEGVRRFPVRRVRYFIYYRVADNKIEILAFWHASRRSGPPI